MHINIHEVPIYLGLYTLLSVAVTRKSDVCGPNISMEMSVLNLLYQTWNKSVYHKCHMFGYFLKHWKFHMAGHFLCQTSDMLFDFLVFRNLTFTLPESRTHGIQ